MIDFKRAIGVHALWSRVLGSLLFFGLGIVALVVFSPSIKPRHRCCSLSRRVPYRAESTVPDPLRLLVETIGSYLRKDEQ